MRHLTWWVAASLAVTALACGGSNSTSPVSPGEGTAVPPSTVPEVPGSVAASGSLGSATRQGDLETAALAIYTVDINPEALTATSRLKETRAGQANDDLYLLSIDSFLNAGSFKITGITADAQNVELGYVVTHPFPAPNNPTGTPNGSTNRADLGISGMVLFLADVTSATGNTYFTDKVANTDLVAYADAYYSPGALLSTTGIANTFPYRLLVDETAIDGSRVGVSNGGNVSGNFGTDGWTRSEFGATNDGWTGYGVLHQGQASASSVALAKSELAGGFSLDVAIIAKYADPRGGATAAQKKANRLPPASPDASLFAYRMPHGALDAQKFGFLGQSGDFIANTISGATLSFRLEDWDARATETAAADLSEDASFTTVAVGESGTPTFEVCIPDVLGDATTVIDMSTVVDDDSAFGGDAGADSGQPGDALFYSALVTKGAGSGQTAGDFTGMVRATDPEVALVIGLDEGLAPLPTTPDPVTYQAFTAVQIPDNAPPTAVVTLTSGDPLTSGTPASVAVTSISDPDNDNLDVLVDWDNGGGFVTVATGLTGPAYPDQTPSSPNMNNADLTPDTIDVVVRIDDGTAQVDIPVSYTLGPNRAPAVTNSRVLAATGVTTPATFTMNAGTGTATDPEGDAISYTITNNRNSDQVTFATFPNAANTTALTGPPDKFAVFTVYANDALHPTTGGTAYPTVTGNILPVSPGGWYYNGYTQGTGFQTPYDIATGPGGVVYFVGSFGAGVNFGDGPTAASADYLVKLDQFGQFVWKREILAATNALNTSKFENILNVVVRPSGNVVIMGDFDGDIDFGGGLRSTDVTFSTTTSYWYVAEYTSANAYVADRCVANLSPGDCTIPTSPSGNAMALDPADGDIAICGSFDRTQTAGALSLVNPNNPVGTVEKPFVWKLNSSLVPQWGYTPLTATDTAFETFNAVAFDSAGNVWAGGDGESNINFGGGVRNPPFAATGSAGSLVKINGTTGAWMDDRMYQSTPGTQFDDVFAIATDASRVYITGDFKTGVNFGGGPVVIAATGSGHMVAALNYSMVQQWVWSAFGDTNFDELWGLATNGTHVYAVGETYNGIDFGFGPVTTGASSTDPVAIKLNAATGAAVWADGFLCNTGTADDFANIALDAAGDVYTIGDWEDIAADWNPGAGVFNATPTGTQSNFIVNHWMTASNAY